MNRIFNAWFKQNAKSNEEDLEIGKIAIKSIAYALIIEDHVFL